MNDRDLYFLLKDKYCWSQNEISEYLTRACDSNSCQTMYLTPEEKADIELLNKGVPVDYIIGYVEFLGCHIDLSYKPLIPRTETEYWVDVEIKNIIANLSTKSNTLQSGKSSSEQIKILDIFSGSGCIGIAVYKRLSQAGFNVHVTFSDISDNAIKQIKKNVEINKLPKGAYSIIKSNIFENVSGRFDYIFANPPYIAEVDKVDETTKHEPQIALYSDDNGLKIIKQFLPRALTHLNDNGNIFMEFGHNQKKQIEKYLNSLSRKDLNIQYEFKKDQFGKNRLIVITTTFKQVRYLT